MIRIVALLLCAIAVPVSAQAVYKCKDAKQGTVYQATPCPEGQGQKHSSIAAAQPQVRATTPQAPSLGAELIGSVRAPSAEACQRATHVRDSALKDPSMNQDADFMQAVRKAVTEACR